MQHYSYIVTSEGKIIPLILQDCNGTDYFLIPDNILAVDPKHNLEEVEEV